MAGNHSIVLFAGAVPRRAGIVPLISHSKARAKLVFPGSRVVEPAPCSSAPERFASQRVITQHLCNFSQIPSPPAWPSAGRHTMSEDSCDGCHRNPDVPITNKCSAVRFALFSHAQRGVFRSYYALSHNSKGPFGFRTQHAPNQPRHENCTMVEVGYCDAWRSGFPRVADSGFAFGTGFAPRGFRLIDSAPDVTSERFRDGTKRRRRDTPERREARTVDAQADPQLVEHRGLWDGGLRTDGCGLLPDGRGLQQ